MYGPRPKPANLAAQLGLGLSVQPSESTRHHSSWSAACVIDDDSNYLARVLVQSSVEPCASGLPRLQRLPMNLATSQLNEIEPAARDFKLRCDLYEGVGLPVGPLEGV